MYAWFYSFVLISNRETGLVPAIRDTRVHRVSHPTCCTVRSQQLHYFALALIQNASYYPDTKQVISLAC